MRQASRWAVQIEQPEHLPHCTVFERGVSAHDRPVTSETLANARLIAAAPDLLEALKGLIEQLIGIGIPEWHGAEGLDLSQARTAITKVTGL